MEETLFTSQLCTFSALPHWFVVTRYALALSSQLLPAISDWTGLSTGLTSSVLTEYPDLAELLCWVVRLAIATYIENMRSCNSESSTTDIENSFEEIVLIHVIRSSKHSNVATNPTLLQTCRVL